MNAEDVSEYADSVGNFLENPQFLEINTGIFLLAVIIIIGLSYFSYRKRKSNIMA